MAVNVTKDPNIKIRPGLPAGENLIFLKNKPSFSKLNNTGLTNKTFKEFAEKKRIKTSHRVQKKTQSTAHLKQIKSGLQIPIQKPEKIFGFRRKKKLFLKWPRDIFYQSRWLNKLLNRTMTQGKKGLAEKTMIRMLEYIRHKVGCNPVLLFHQALNQVKPVLTVLPKRVGRRTYQIPVPLDTFKQYKTALKWLHIATQKNTRVPLSESLAEELINTVFFKRSEALRRKNELYDTVIKNRAYTHYRWF